MPQLQIFRPVQAETKIELRENEFALDSKRHPRTQSLENTAKTSSSKHHTSQRIFQPLKEISEAAKNKDRYETAYVVDLMG